MAASHVCFDCVGDPHLREEIRRRREAEVCLNCDRKRSAIPLEALAKRIDDAIFENFVQDEAEEGPGYATLIQREAKLPRSVAETIRDFFATTIGIRSEMDGELNLWRDACFTEARLDREDYRRRWTKFRTSIREQGRFYNKTAEAILNDIFKDVLDAKTWRDEPAVVELTPSESLPPFIRGRVAKSDAELVAILSDPAAQLGPPPSAFASAGRMNAAGVSVFYCASEPEICCKECRPPVGSHMVYGYFELIRSIRVLNLSRLVAMMVPEQSIFAPDFSDKMARAGFLRQIDWEISLPVMPGDESFGYLHTQAVADYLAHRLGLDGVYYRSTQSGLDQGGDAPPLNLVLFHHASRVEPVETQGCEVDVDLGWWDEDEEDGDDAISVSITEKPKVEEAPKPRDPMDEWGTSPEPEPGDERPMTLRIQRDRLRVEKVMAAAYQRSARGISVSRTSEAEMAENEERMKTLFGG
jgi:hypothetical protein